MELEQKIDALEGTLKQLFNVEGSGHDFYHLLRTKNLALNIQKSEGGDKTVVCISALLHDVHRLIQNDTGTYCSPNESLRKVKIIMDDSKIDLTYEQTSRILHCIKYHEEYSFSKGGKTVNDIETLILQDAGNLDAMGAIGIGRAFTFSGENDIIMWTPDIPFRKESYSAKIKDPTTIHHFYSKLLQLKNNMNTLTAKNMAIKRHEFMEVYLSEFFEEWKGIK